MIKPLQSLRFFAITGIFLFHLFVIKQVNSDFYMQYFNYGYCGVTFFIILSGFVMSYNYLDNYREASFISSITFLKKRIQKIYPVHLLTLLFALPLAYKAFAETPVKSLSFLLLNVSLLQSFIPVREVYFSFNAVSWFLSICVFFYIITPFLLKFANKIKNLKTIFLIIVILYFMLSTAVFLGRDSKHSHWLFYISPYFRLGDYVIGILCGLYIKRKPINTISNKLSYTLLELIAIVAFFIVYFSSSNINEVYTYGIYYLPVMTFLILVFSLQKGFLSKMFSNRMLVYLGGISFEFYMIHELVIRYLTYFTKEHFPIVSSISCYIISIICAIFINFFLGKNINIKHANKYLKTV